VILFFPEAFKSFFQYTCNMHNILPDAYVVFDFFDILL